VAESEAQLSIRYWDLCGS